MTDFTKREYLKLTAASLGVFALGTAGLVATNNVADVTGPSGGGSGQYAYRSGDRLDYERDDDGDIEFDWEDISFETHDGDRDIDFTVSSFDVELDFETDNDGEEVEFSLAVGGEVIDFEFDHRRGEDDEIEFTSNGRARKFENEDGEVEYRGEAINFEWETDGRELDVKGDIMFEFDGDELEYRGTDIHIQWKRGRRGKAPEFEARML